MHSFQARHAAGRSERLGVEVARDFLRGHGQIAAVSEPRQWHDAPGKPSGGTQARVPAAAGWRGQWREWRRHGEAERRRRARVRRGAGAESAVAVEGPACDETSTERPSPAVSSSKSACAPGGTVRRAQEQGMPTHGTVPRRWGPHTASRGTRAVCCTAPCLCNGVAARIRRGRHPSRVRVSPSAESGESMYDESHVGSK